MRRSETFHRRRCLAGVGPTFGVLDDLRMAARTLSRSVWFSILAILVLGVGLGATIAAFSAFDAVLARDLPVRHPEELVTFHWLRTNDSMVAAYSGYGRPPKLDGGSWPR